VGKFNTYLSKQNKSQGQYRDHYDQWVDFEITGYENSRLEEKYPEFRYMMQEYHDGILLFNISEQKIWNYAAEDSTGLEAYYKDCKKYMWEERFKGMIVTCTSDSVREEAENYFASDLPKDEVLELINKNGDLITITEGAWEKGANAVVDYYVWNGPEPEGFKSELTFVRGDKIPPEPKKLEDARGLYISDYQKVIEERWLKELHSKYKVVINKKLLKTIPGV
jgi:peptidyl-prolyl cis-trans isomerase SurA